MNRAMILVLLCLGANILFAAEEAPPPLKLVRTIALPHVEGRIDHFAIGPRSEWLYVTALGNNTLEAVKLADGTVTTLKRLKEPRGAVVIPELNRLFVTNGEAASADVYDSVSLKHITRIDLADDADNIRYDTRAKRVYVGHGSGGSSAIGSIDPATNTRGTDIKLADHPESFQLEAKGPRIFVNVPGAKHVAVIDRSAGKVIATWPLKEAAKNFPMALDEADHRLFVGCRSPAKLLVLDTDSGKVVAAMECVGDADDVFYDADAKRVYISGGEGAITVVAQRDADHYEPVAKVPTASGARTCLFDPATHSLYLAVPHRGSQPAEVRVFQTR
jgi:DNA-binding beta-propeller fold protein YncE